MKIENNCLTIEPVLNGWIVRIHEALRDFGSGFPTSGTHVFINEKDLGRFVEDFYSKKNDH